VSALVVSQDGLKLSVDTVFTSRQIRWSPNFSRTVDNNDIQKVKGGKCLVLPQCIEIWGHPPPPAPYLVPPLLMF